MYKPNKISLTCLQSQIMTSYIHILHSTLSISILEYPLSQKKGFKVAGQSYTFIYNKHPNHDWLPQYKHSQTPHPQTSTEKSPNLPRKLANFLPSHFSVYPSLEYTHVIVIILRHVYSFYLCHHIIKYSKISKHKTVQEN